MIFTPASRYLPLSKRHRRLLEWVLIAPLVIGVLLYLHHMEQVDDATQPHSLNAPAMTRAELVMAVRYGRVK